MLFVRHESFRSYIRFYPVTSMILAVNLVIFILDLILDRQLSIWGMFFQEPIANRFGLAEPWRFVSSIILHAGWEHLLFNCFATLVFAPPLERLLGHMRYLIFYIVAGVAGNVLSAIVHAGTLAGSVGASGAIYGVFGSFLYLAIFHKNILDESTRKTIYGILVLGVIYSLLVPNINIWAHIGGAAAGFGMMKLLIFKISLMNKLRNNSRSSGG